MHWCFYYHQLNSLILMMLNRSPSLVSILLLTPWILHLVCFHPLFWVRSTMKLLVVYRRFFRTTRIFKISLPFWEWMSLVKMINWLLPVPVRSSDSWASLSMSLKSSLVPQENMWNWRRTLAASRYCFFLIKPDFIHLLIKGFGYSLW